MNRDWVLRAACRDHPNPDQWHPTRSFGGGYDYEYAETITAAKNICAGCPVADECVTDAHAFEAHRLVNGGQRGRYGIWGGTTPRERERHAKQQGAHK